jgi:hypothetical protein
MAIAITGRRARSAAAPRGGRARILAAGVAVLAAAGLGACTGDEGETCEVATEDLSAVALVVDSGWDIRAAIDFEAGDRRGRNSPLRLCDTDALVINDTIPDVIAKSDRVEYSISLPVDGARSFTFELDREAQGDRVVFEVELPPAFEIIAPMDGDAIDYTQDQVLQWEPALEGGTMHVGLGEVIGSGECLAAQNEGHTYEAAGGVQVDDTGQWTIPAGSVSSMSLESCTLTYTLSRVLLAPYPDALEGSGRIEARTERYVDVTTMQ